MSSPGQIRPEMAVAHRFLLAAAIFLGALFQLRGAPLTLAEFPFQYRENLLWVEVGLPQSKQPLNFLLDSGAGVSVINLATAKRLGLELGPEIAVRGVEAMVTGYRQRRMTAKVGGIDLPHELLAVDLEKLSGSCERQVDGLVGADFFRGRVVQIDFEAKEIRLLKQIEKSDKTVTLKLRPSGMRLPIGVNGHKRQWVRLDTGCATALQWVTSDARTGACARQMAIGLSEVSIPQARTFVRIGDQEFENVPTGLHETAIFPGEAGLLGNGLLSRFSTVTIDVAGGRVALQKRPPAQ